MCIRDRRKTEHFTASANDAFATIRITARDSTEECYAEILDYLCAVLEQEEFPRSYSVEFRGKEKIYLPIPGLPKKGVNQLFAYAVQHPNLHPAMERYARLAMREYEYYQNLADEFCAMPGTCLLYTSDYPEAMEYLLGGCAGTLMVSPPVQRHPKVPFELSLIHISKLIMTKVRPSLFQIDDARAVLF